MPVYELLGGQARNKARIYGHIYEKTIDKLLAECERKMAHGFNAFGHLNPFLDEGHDQVYFKPHVKKIRDAVDNVRRIQETVGDQVDLLVELHRRLTPAEAVAFANDIEHLHPMFVEDPIRPEGLDAMARVARQIRVPIATGERFATIYEFQALMARDAVEFARVDLCLCGGITGARKVAAIAEAHHVQVVPHNPLSPIGLAACLQLAAAIPNFAIQEYATGFKAGVFESQLHHLGSDIVDAVPALVDGFVDIPNGPGLGMALIDNAAKIRPPADRPISMRPHYDGVVVDQ